MAARRLPVHSNVRPTFWQQERRQKPARSGTAAGNVVGVNVYGVPANGISGERDRVAFGDEVMTTHVEHRGVVAHPRSHDDAGVAGENLIQQPFQMVRWEFAQGERP